MKKWFKKDKGTTILYGPEEEVTEQHPLAEEIIAPPSSDHIFDAKLDKWIPDPEAYARHRREEYPDIGDQLDAILKALNYMQMSGQTDLVVDMDTIIGKWLSVKSKYPKPE